MAIATIDVDLTPLGKADAERYIEQYTGVWVAEPTRFSQMSAFIEQLSLLRGGGLVRTPMPRSKSYSVDQVRIVEIEIQGAMTKCGSCLSGAGSMIEQRRAVAAIAKGNPALHKAFLIATNPPNPNGAAECADALHR